jgi:hypothetical protein
MELLENHEIIQERNEEVIRDLGVDISKTEVDSEYSARISDQFMKYFLKPEYYKQYLESKLQESSVEDKEKFSVAEKIAQENVSFLVLRPEMYHMGDQVESFLSKNGYGVIGNITESKKISEDIYWEMYKEAITNPMAFESMPTRTLVYTGGPSKIIFFRDLIEERRRGSNTADVFFERYKGVAGVPQSNTLRGDIIYNEAKRLGFNSLERRGNISVVDPFYTYRHAVNRGSGPHTKLTKDQILFYTGVSIHVPNHSEVAKDLNAIFSKEELENILRNVKS